MTLEELLKDIKNKKACAEANYKECIAREHGCKDCPFAHVGIDILYPELIERLEELKDYREGLRVCENCKYGCKDGAEYPCSICGHNRPSEFEWKEGVQNDT